MMLFEADASTCKQFSQFNRSINTADSNCFVMNYERTCAHGIKSHNANPQIGSAKPPALIRPIGRDDKNKVAFSCFFS